EPGLPGGGLDRDRLVGLGEEVLDVAEGEPAGLRRAADLLQRVAALAQPRDEPRLRGGLLRPAPVGALRDEARALPPAQGLGRHAGAPRDLRRGELLAHSADSERRSGGSLTLREGFPPPAGTARLFSRGVCDSPGSDACLVPTGVPLPARGVKEFQTARCGYSSTTTA